MKPLKIGDLKLKNPLLLSPMVDVTDLPYRLICRKAGAGMAYTPMLYVSAILHKNRATEDLMKSTKEDRPLGLQITGDRQGEFKELSPYLKGFDLVDINCGCPSLRIIGSKAGSYLLMHPEKIAGMIKILKSEKVNPEGIPVTAKIRLGFKQNNVLEVAKSVEKAGADAITLHARLATQGGKTPADWKWIAKVKENVGIPVIGNGDIFNGEKAAEMLDIADGAMVARGAIGDPYIFERILHYLKTGKEKEFDFKKNLKAFQEYITLSKKHKLLNIQRVKYLGTNFLRNIEGAAKMRDNLMKCRDIKSIEKYLGGIE